jgi:two-component system chemotaxis response regulator CheB
MEAREAIKELDPDVVTLDIEMPNMNGLEFLEKIMRLRPMPVIMVSTLTHRGAEATLAALEIGAFDCVGKPQPGDPPVRRSRRKGQGGGPLAAPPFPATRSPQPLTPPPMPSPITASAARSSRSDRRRAASKP